MYSLPQGRLVKLFCPPGNGITIGRAELGSVPLYLTKLEHFEDYRADARRILRVISGNPQGDDLEILPQMGLNAMGISNLLAALAFEISEG